MVDELRLRPANQAASALDEAVATLLRVEIDGQPARAIVLPERLLDSLGLDVGAQFLIEKVEETSFTVEFKYALDAVAIYLKTTRRDLVAKHPIGLLNTPEGERQYRRVRTSVPNLPVAKCKNGLAVRAGYMDFLYLNPEIWDSGHDVLPTAIHMIFHTLEPDLEEDAVIRKTEEVCQMLPRSGRRHTGPGRGP